MADSSEAGAKGSSADPEYTLVLHTIPPGITIPNVSPYVFKLETYLRLAGIKYKIDTNKPFGPKGKTPWITFNGQTVDDSELIIDFLNKTLHKDIWGNASREEKAAAHAMGHMIQYHLLLGLADWRWVAGLSTIDKVLAVSGIKLYAMKFFFGRKVKAILHDNGFLRHSPEERMTMIRKDFKAISDYLGDKAFFLGEEPTEIDATVFGILAQFLYAAPGSPYDKVFEEYKNVKDYCERMKGKLWPDWDTVLHK